MLYLPALCRTMTYSANIEHLKPEYVIWHWSEFRFKMLKSNTVYLVDLENSSALHKSVVILHYIDLKDALVTWSRSQNSFVVQCNRVVICNCVIILYAQKQDNFSQVSNVTYGASYNRIPKVGAIQWFWTWGGSNVWVEWNWMWRFAGQVGVLSYSFASLEIRGKSRQWS